MSLIHRRWMRAMLMLAALWWGGISGIAFVAVPALFAQLGSPAVAGPVAAWLFGVVCKLSLVAGCVLFLFYMQKMQLALHKKARVALIFVVIAVLAAVLQDTVVAHQIITARATDGNLKLWHGLGSGLVLLQWLAAGWQVWFLSGASDPS
jgi:hypothetical protein